MESNQPTDKINPPIVIEIESGSLVDSDGGVADEAIASEHNACEWAKNALRSSFDFDI